MDRSRSSWRWVALSFHRKNSDENIWNLQLDPAGPLFSASNPDERVSPTDGAYVEVIHTNMGRLGFSEPIGQADFFPNFGVIMPGCESDLTGQCSHSRSHLFYAESINRPFTSQECSSFFEIENGQCTPTGRTGLMGGPHPKHGLTGVFYLATNADSPFSRGWKTSSQFW